MRLGCGHKSIKGIDLLWKWVYNRGNNLIMKGKVMKAISKKIRWANMRRVLMMVLFWGVAFVVGVSAGLVYNQGYNDGQADGWCVERK